VDSFLGIAATVDAVLAGRGAVPCDRIALRGMIGAPLERIFAALVPGLLAEGAGEHVAEYLRLYPTLGVPASPLFDGVRPVLDACRAAGLRLAVVTTKRTRVAQAVLDAGDIAGYFATVVGADAAPRPKPDAAPARVALERLGVAPGAATVVGDTEFDVGMALAAGCRAVGAGWGYRPPAALRAAGAAAVAGYPEDLLPLLLPPPAT
jgi:phosphoglycolate phosphatase-like HAD superfamily hydrolase